MWLEARMEPHLCLCLCIAPLGVVPACEIGTAGLDTRRVAYEMPADGAAQHAQERRNKQGRGLGRGRGRGEANMNYSHFPSTPYSSSSSAMLQ